MADPTGSPSERPDNAIYKATDYSKQKRENVLDEPARRSKPGKPLFPSPEAFPHSGDSTGSNKQQAVMNRPLRRSRKIHFHPDDDRDAEGYDQYREDYGKDNPAQVEFPVEINKVKQ